MMILYHTLWTAAALLLSPVLLFDRKGRLGSRMAPRLPGRPPREGCLWVHALSVGEVLSAVPLVRELRRRYGARNLAMTVTTVQGMELALRELREDVELILPMPLDFWGAYRRLRGFLRPRLFVIVETDIWPGLIGSLRADNVPTLIVNGRISPRTHRGYRRMGPFSRAFIHAPERWLVQSGLDRDRLLDAGADPARVVVSGNIKFDREWLPMEDAERAALAAALGVGAKDTVWVAGSTHPGEEDVLLRVYKELQNQFPSLKMILAPRRIERAGELRGLAAALSVKAAFRSARNSDKEGARVVILDTLGELGRVYGLGTVSFVGGSLVPVGGHNLLEPAWFGCPVLFGPHVHNFAAMADLLEEAGGGIRVHDQRGLHREVEALLEDPSRRGRMGERARNFVAFSRGALGRVLENIEGFAPHEH